MIIFFFSALGIVIVCSLTNDFVSDLRKHLVQYLLPVLTLILTAVVILTPLFIILLLWILHHVSLMLIHYFSKVPQLLIHIHHLLLIVRQQLIQVLVSLNR
jgi:hypothetical protein